MDDYSVTISDPGEEYWNMEPISYSQDPYQLTWGDQTGPTYEEMGYDPTYQQTGPTYEEMGYDPTYQQTGPTYEEMGYTPPVEQAGPTYEEMGYNGPGYSQGGTYGEQATGPGQNGQGQQRQPQQGGYGQQQGYPQQQGQQQNRGLLGGLFGGNGQGQGGGGGFGDILGTLGGLALVGGVGALLGSMLSGKSSGSVTPGTVSAPSANYLPPKQLATPGVNPGYAMGASAAPAMGSTTSNLGKISTMAPAQPIMPQQSAPAPMPQQSAPAPMPVAPMPMNPTGMTGQPLALDQIRSMIGM